MLLRPGSQASLGSLLSTLCCRVSYNSRRRSLNVWYGFGAGCNFGPFRRLFDVENASVRAIVAELLLARRYDSVGSSLTPHTVFRVAVSSAVAIVATSVSLFKSSASLFPRSVSRHRTWPGCSSPQATERQQPPPQQPNWQPAQIGACAARCTGWRRRSRTEPPSNVL